MSQPGFADGLVWWLGLLSSHPHLFHLSPQGISEGLRVCLTAPEVASRQHSCSMGISLGAGLSRGWDEGPGKRGSSTPGCPGIGFPKCIPGEAWGVGLEGWLQSLSWASLGLDPRTGKVNEIDMANAEGF